jgi:hypothetical protein
LAGCRHCYTTQPSCHRKSGRRLLSNWPTHAFKYERGKLTGVFALVGLAMISERVDVGPEIQKALKYDDQDVQRIARLLQDETEQTWTPTTLLDAVQSDRVDVSKQAIAAVRLMVDAAKEQS